MDVEDPVRKAGDSRGAEDSHEASEHQRLSSRCLGDPADLLGELGPVTPILNHRGRDGGRSSPLERETSFDIADEQPETGNPGVDEGLKVGAGAAGENREFDGELPFRNHRREKLGPTGGGR